MYPSDLDHMKFVWSIIFWQHQLIFFSFFYTDLKFSQNSHAKTNSSHLDIAVVVASVAAVARVHQNSVEAVHYRVAWALRHVGSDIQEFWVAHILQTPDRTIRSLKNEVGHLKKKGTWQENGVNLCYFASAKVGEPLQRDSQDVRGPVDCETFGCRHLLFASERWK